MLECKSTGHGSSRWTSANILVYYFTESVNSLNMLWATDISYNYVLQWCRKVDVAWCRWRLKLSSSRVLLHRRHLTSTASPAAVPRHILGVLKLPPDNASTSVYSTLLPCPCRRTDHVTLLRLLLLLLRVDNMATCWRTTGGRQCVVDVDVNVTSSCQFQTTSSSLRLRTANTLSWSK